VTIQPAHGFCVWLTGLSGSGKTTIAQALRAKLEARGRRVSMLDGDAVRTHLSKELGYSRADRDTNVLRIGFVAREVVAHGGAVICAVVSPYRASRDLVRDMVGPDRLLEIFVDTPLEVCEARDVKGLYARARRGEIEHFTGLDDPYEPPLLPDLVLHTVATTPEANAAAVIFELERRSLLAVVGRPASGEPTGAAGDMTPT